MSGHLETGEIKYRSTEELSKEEKQLFDEMENCRILAENIGASFVELHLRVCQQGLLQLGCDDDPESLHALGEIKH